MKELIACALTLSGVATADDADDRAEAGRISTNPLPYVENLKLEPKYTFSHGDTLYKSELELEGVLPYDGALIPGLAIDDVWSIARVQITGESLQDSQGTASGLENLSFVALAARRFGALSLAGGAGTVFPLATSPALGPAKWQLGPAIAFRYEPAPMFTIAALAQALWSVAGSTEVARQSYITLQPFVTLHLGGGLLVTSDATMSFYWVGGSTSVPIDLGVGYAFSKRFVGTIKGQVTVAGHDQGSTQVIWQLTFLP